jgi:hypothetical protein
MHPAPSRGDSIAPLWTYKAASISRTIHNSPPIAMATGSFQTLFTFVSLSIHVLQALSLPACPPKSDAEFDFVVVGAGVGGGPVAARLAESGFSGTHMICHIFFHRC